MEALEGSLGLSQNTKQRQFELNIEQKYFGADGCTDQCKVESMRLMYLFHDFITLEIFIY